MGQVAPCFGLLSRGSAFYERLPCHETGSPAGARCETIHPWRLDHEGHAGTCQPEVRLMGRATPANKFERHVSGLLNHVSRSCAAVVPLARSFQKQCLVLTAAEDQSGANSLTRSCQNDMGATLLQRTSKRESMFVCSWTPISLPTALPPWGQMVQDYRCVQESLPSWLHKAVQTCSGLHWD